MTDGRLRELAGKVDALVSRFDSLALRSDDVSGTFFVESDVPIKVLGMSIDEFTCRYKVTYSVKIEATRLRPSSHDEVADIIQEACSEKQWKEWEYVIPPGVIKQVTDALWAEAKKLASSEEVMAEATAQIDSRGVR